MASTSPESNRREFGIYLGTALAIVVAFVLRGSDRYFAPQMWAEDGQVFFKDAFELGAASIFKPHQGYVQLLHRLIAWMTVSTGAYADLPAMWVWLAAIIDALVLAVFATRLYAPLIPDVRARVALALVAAAGGMHHEILGTLTNHHWYFVAAGLHLLVFVRFGVTPPPSRRLETLLVIATAFIALSSPQLIIFVPMLALTALLGRRTLSASAVRIASAFILCELVQIGVYLANRNPSGAASGSLGAGAARVPLIFLRRHVLQNMLPPAFGQWLQERALVAALLLSILLAALVIVAVARAGHRLAVVGVAALLLLNIAVVFVGRPDRFVDAHSLSELASVTANHDARYYYLGYLCFLLLAAIAISHRWPKLQLAVCAVVLVQLIAALSTFRNTITINAVDFSWRAEARKLRALKPGETTQVAVAPGWSFGVRKPE